MARYYSYGRRRYGRRYYRRGYRRYGGTSLRRYRSVQMNDNETRVMTFTGVSRVLLPVTSITAVPAPGSGTPPSNPIPSGSVVYCSWTDLLRQSQVSAQSSGDSFTPQSGRIFFAGMMFDRIRVRSLSVSIRPLILPSSGETGNPTITLYAAWDRYGSETISSNALPTYTSIMSDPSAKSITWTSGGSGSPLRTWIYSMSRDRYQYAPIRHIASLVSWLPNRDTTSPLFYPLLHLTLIGQNTVTSPQVQLQILTRATIEFQGGYSNTTLNYVPPSGTNTVSATDPLEERMAALERMYNSNPADNNDDLVSVLNELSNPQ